MADKRVAVATDQATAFLGVNLQNQIPGLVFLLFDLHDEAKIAQYGVQ